MRILSILIVVLALGALAPPGRVAAQDEPMASPAADQARAIPPEACRVAPRPAAEVFARLGLGEGTAAATPAPRTPVPAPPWTAADEATAEAVTAVIQEWLACINADDNFRLAALMTDAALVRFFGGALAPDEAIEGARANLAGTPAPRAAEARVRLVAVTDVSMLADGRVAALALINEPVLPPRGQETLLLLFAHVGDRWRIDDILQFSVVPVVGGTPQAATPQP
jgi:ketosteroid isomerase-like protein